MVLSLERWVGKVAIVTGASAGIGAAIAKQLVENGIIVAGLARRVEKIEESAKKLAGKKGKLHAVKADITKEEELLAAFKWVKDNLGPVHILVNNAGVLLRGSIAVDETETWRKMFDLNVLALSIATREAVKVMRANNIDGHIIHINSLAGHEIVGPGLSSYAATKFAVRALAETLRQELNHLGTKIKITNLSPGATESEMTLQGNEALAKLFKEAGADILKAEDIADGVVYVLSTPPHVQVHELTLRPISDNVREIAKKLVAEMQKGQH